MFTVFLFLLLTCSTKAVEQKTAFSMKIHGFKNRMVLVFSAEIEIHELLLSKYIRTRMYKLVVHIGCFLKERHS